MPPLSLAHWGLALALALAATLWYELPKLWRMSD
jgi:hypothetical protein